MTYNTKYNEISGIGVSSLSDENIRQNQQGTFYGGLQITDEVKRQLEEQEIGLFVQFDKQEDNSYIMRPQIPEKGMSEDGKTYSIRKNMNRILKGIASRFVDKDGVVDLEKGVHECERLQFRITDPEATNEMKEDVYRELAGYHSLSRKEKKDFDSFIQSNGYDFERMMNNLMQGIRNNLSSLKTYNQNLYNSAMDENKTALLKDSEQDFEQFLDDFRHMAKMDPTTEKHTYIPGECSTSGVFNHTFYKDVLRAGKGADYIPKQNSCREHLALSGNYQEEVSFSAHILSAFDVKIGNQDAVITLETTAPPGAKLVFHPERFFGGIGVYDNREKIQEMYKADNKRTFGNIPTKERMNQEAGENYAYCPTLPDSVSLLNKMKSNTKLFEKNSTEYDAVSKALEDITKIEKKMKDNPSQANKYRNELRDKCKVLADCSQQYLDSRNPSSDNGKHRYNMVQKSNEYAAQLANRMDRLYKGELSFHKNESGIRKAVKFDALLEEEGMARNRRNAIKKTSKESKEEIRKRFNEIADML